MQLWGNIYLLVSWQKLMDVARKNWCHQCLSRRRHGVNNMLLKGRMTSLWCFDEIDFLEVLTSWTNKVTSELFLIAN